MKPEIKHSRGALRLGLTGDSPISILPKAYYFFYYSALASLMPFLAIYYQGLGLSGSQIGLLSAIPPLVMLIAAPLWGGLADAHQQHRRLLLLAIAGVQFAVLLLMTAASFAWLIILVLVYSLFAAPIVPLIDNTVIDLLGERKHLYGRQRLWGAVGWGLTAPVVGWLTGRYGLTWPLWGFIILMVGVFLVSWVVPISHARLSTSFWNNLGTMLSDRRWIFFLAIVFTAGLGFALINSFLLLYMGDLGGSKTLMGFSLTVATISELPFWFFSDWFLKHWGARRVLSIALAVLGARMLVMSLIREPWLILLPQLTHGITFAALWAASVAYASQIAPKGMGATAQSLFAAVLSGLGGSVGAFIGGLMYEHTGPQSMFLWAGVVITLAVAVFIFLGIKSAARETLS
jgi:PPP family 3-phenylpropionic acid transporter